MTTLTTRYNHGDVVWHRRTHVEAETATCPLCLGKARVHVVGTDREANCPECWYGTPRRAGDGLVYTGREVTRAIIEPRTIGHVRVEWTAGELARVTYMAWESGVGSGSILAEGDLYPTREDAEAVPVPAPVEPRRNGGAS